MEIKRLKIIAKTEILGYSTTTLYTEVVGDKEPEDYWCETLSESSEVLATDYVGRNLSDALEGFNTHCKVISDTYILELLEKANR